jgi:3-phenylpropionate/trans-cinnamate dioxygenase ferredoxin subunit
MTRYTRVASVDDLPAGAMKGVRVGRMEILIANLDGSLVAVGDVCTHAQCNLSDGELEASNVICPCHGGEFNLRTGVVEVGPPEENLPIYYIRVRDNDIEVGFPDE